MEIGMEPFKHCLVSNLWLSLLRRIQTWHTASLFQSAPRCSWSNMHAKIQTITSSFLRVKETWIEFRPSKQNIYLRWKESGGRVGRQQDVNVLMVNRLLVERQSRWQESNLISLHLALAWWLSECLDTIYSTKQISNLLLAHSDVHCTIMSMLLW